MSHYTDDSDAKRAAAEKMRETRRRLGPRYGLPAEKVRLPADYAGPVAPRARQSGVVRGHPTRDSGSA
jgi:hypothetical protein